MKLWHLLGAAILALAVVCTAGAQYKAMVLPLPPSYPWSVGNGASASVYGGYSVPTGGSSARDERAFLWVRGVPRDVTPLGYHAAQIVGSGGGQHVGSVSANPNAYVPFAFVWNATGVGTLLHPSEFSSSEATGVGGGRQVGNVLFASYCSECGYFVERHAAMWSGTAQSFVKLHAPAFDEARAEDTDGVTVVGSAYLGQQGQYRAIIWLDPLTIVDLHSTNYSSTFGTAVGGGSQVGWGETSTDESHALLWHGTPGSVIDLHPPGYLLTVANGVSGNTQVGAGRTIQPGPDRALAWHGTSQSMVDLHRLLPPGFRLRSSVAEDIDQFGNIVGTCAEDSTGLPRAVVWLRSSWSIGY